MSIPGLCFARGRGAPRSGFLDRHAGERVALLDRVDDLLPAADLAEDGMLAIKPVGRDVGDEELAAVRVRTGVGHRQRPALVLAVLAGAQLVLELVPRPAAAGALGVAALDHEVLNDELS